MELKEKYVDLVEKLRRDREAALEINKIEKQKRKLEKRKKREETRNTDVKDLKDINSDTSNSIEDNPFSSNTDDLNAFEVTNLSSTSSGQGKILTRRTPDIKIKPVMTNDISNQNYKKRGKVEKEREKTNSVCTKMENKTDKEAVIKGKLKTDKANEKDSIRIKKNTSSKKYINTEAERKKIRERVRNYRSRLTEDALAKKREKDREYIQQKRAKEVPFSSLPDKQKKRLRKVWRENARVYRAKKKQAQQFEKYLDEITPPSSPLTINQPDEIINIPVTPPRELPPRSAVTSRNTPKNSDIHPSAICSRASSSRKECGRKRVSRERSKVFRRLTKAEEELAKVKKQLQNYKQKADRYRKVIERMNKAKIARKTDKQAFSPSPLTKVSKLIGKHAVPEGVKKKLLFGEIITEELKRKKHKSGKKEKQTIAKLVSNKYFKKYRMLGMAKGIVEYKDAKNIATGKLFSCKSKNSQSLFLREQKNVLRFLQDDENSRMCPGKKDHKKGYQKRLLLDSMKVLHQKYKSKYSSHISYSTFLRLRPTWIVQPKMTDRDTCMCVKHSNFEYILYKMKQLKIIRCMKFDSVCSLLCCNINRKECMYRQCPTCSARKITLDTSLIDEPVTFCQWKRVVEKRNIKQVEKTVQRMIKEKIHTNTKEMMSAFEEQLTPFLKHHFNMRHQYNKIREKVENLSDNEALLRIDFSENFVCKYSAEAQAMHFGASKVQLSLHTGVQYRMRFGKPETTSFASVSECLDHGAHAVWAHLTPILTRLKEFPNIKTLHFVSDGPTAQYRNRYNFYLLTNLLSSICPNITQCTWNFTEAGHGKGPMDGVGGVLKRTADKYVARGRDVASVEDFVSLLQEFCKGVMLFTVTPESVVDLKKYISSGISGVPKVMQLHQVTWTQDEPNKIYLRELTCFECSLKEVCKHHVLGKGFVEFAAELPAQSPTKDSAEVPLETGSNSFFKEPVAQMDTCLKDADEIKWVAVVYGQQWYPGKGFY